MPELVTRHFGVVSCQDDAVLFFPLGLPAFETATRFVLIEQPAASPVVFLQNVDDPALSFVLAPILALDPLYQLGISLEDLRVLGLEETRQPEIGSEVECFAIVSVTENHSPTANLLAPVVMNLATRVAVQAVRADTSYSHQYVIGVGAASCS